MTKLPRMVMTISLMAAFVGVVTASTPAAPADAKKIAAALSKLSETDRAAAEAQRWCAVMDDNRLGSMGTPVKVTINGKVVYLCCVGCKKKATKNGEETLTKVADLKKVTAAMAKLSVEDRQSAEAQRFCAVMEESRLGTMGAPVKVTVEGQIVFLCCKGCSKRALADPKTTLARAAKLKQAAEAPQ